MEKQLMLTGEYWTAVLCTVRTTVSMPIPDPSISHIVFGG